ncbi:MAG: nitrilase-related carbon-nitrogen hydrolase, partial [Polyangiaceae bacterium]
VRWFDRRRGLWLLLGIALVAATQVRASVGALAWLAPLPWLRFLRVTGGRRARLLFCLALFAGWTLATAKIATEPTLLALAPLFALPIAAGQAAAYLTWNELRPRVSTALAVFSFAVLQAVPEWAIHSLTPFGSWGAAAYTQLDDLPLLQTASVLGLAGVGSIVNVVGASLESALARDPKSRRVLSCAIAIALFAHCLGTARLTLADIAQAPTVVVAAVDTDSDTRGLPLPSREATHRWDRMLLGRTRDAARGGAVLAVWPEAATLVWPDEEAAWVEAVRASALENDIDIVAAYVVPAASASFAYRNEFRLILRDGRVEPAYAKHHPVPGEPAIRGDGPAPLLERAWGRLSGAICYDYDFPAMGRERARVGADIVAVPASDWRGIDPVHAQMATVRGIESGHSMIRSTRYGLSLGSDPYGRARAWHSSFEPGPGVTFARLPHARVRTLYSIWGDAPLGLATALLAVFVVKRRRRASHALVRDSG